jgi:uncharacterized membrane protein
MDSPKLHSAKLMGGIGSILMLLAFIPVAGFIIGLVGLILVLVAVKYLGDELRDHDVFTNYLLSFIMVIVAVVAFVVVLIFTVFTAAGFNLTNIQDPTFWSNRFMNTSNILSFVGSLILSFLILWIIMIISAFFLNKSFNRIASGTGTHLFHTAGLLYLIGAATIIIFVGVIIIFVAFIIQIIAFFSLPDTLPSATPVTAAPMPPPPPQ